MAEGLNPVRTAATSASSPPSPGTSSSGGSSSVTSDSSPLSNACVKELQNKDYEKRKVAAKEVEKMTRDFVSVQNYSQLDKLVSVLGNFALAPNNVNTRKGGFMGLAATAIGLQEHTKYYTPQMVRPLLTNMEDTDARVRYYALEALFNVIKVAKFNIVPIFGEVYATLGVAVADMDHSIRTSCEMLDRLLKDIVTESAEFQLSSLVLVMRERLHAKSRFSRMFHLSWIEVLEKMANTSFVTFLPDILDGIFFMLEDDSKDIQIACSNVLYLLLKSVRRQPEDVAFAKLVNLVLAHAASPLDRVRTRALEYLEVFVLQAPSTMIPHVGSILAVVLPNHALDETDRIKMSEEEYREIKRITSDIDQDIMYLMVNHVENYQCEKQSKRTPPELDQVLDVLLSILKNQRTGAQEAVLRWYYQLLITCPQKIDRHVDEIFPAVLEILPNAPDTTLMLDIQVLAQLCDPKHEVRKRHFKKCIMTLFGLYSTDKQIMEAKGSLVIRHLCMLLSPESIFRTLAELLEQEENLKLARDLVEELNIVLLSRPETQELREMLRSLKSKGSCEFLVTLYRPWSHSPCALLSLCLISGCFTHAGQIMNYLMKQPSTMHLLQSLDRLVQLLDSPTFSSVRLHLLDSRHNEELLFVLHAILLKLPPEARAYKILLNRLTSVRKFNPDMKCYVYLDEDRVHSLRDSIDFAPLFEHFCTVYAAHFDAGRESRMDYLVKHGMRVYSLDEHSKKRLNKTEGLRQRGDQRFAKKNE